jgi:hypothetical protein
MSDQQLEQTPTEPQASDTDSVATAPSYITRADLEAEISKLRSTLDRNYQGMQSRQDGFEKRVRENISGVDAMIKRLGDMGVQLTPENQESLKRQAWQDALGEPEQPQPNPQEEQINPITALAYQMMDDAGIEDFPEDSPEYAMIMEAASGTPSQYIAAFSKAIASYNARKQQTPQQKAARMPGLSQGKPAGNPIANVTDPDELWNLARKSHS